MTIPWPAKELFLAAMSPVLREIRSESAFFDPLSLIIECEQSSVRPKPGEQGVEISEYADALTQCLNELPDYESRLRFLIQDSAWMHEVHHFYDCMCTPAGLSSFFRELSLYRDLAMSVASLRDGDKLPEEPLFPMYQALLRRHARRDHPLPKTFNDPQEEGVRYFGELFCNMRIQRCIFNGDYGPLRVDRDLSDHHVVWLETDLGDESFRLPTYPTVLRSGDESYPVLMPIGFRQLTENQSIVAQRYLIASFGRDYDHDYALSLRQRGGTYLAVNMMCTRRATSLGVREKYHTEKLYEVVQEALSYAGAGRIGDNAGVHYAEAIEEGRINIEGTKLVDPELMISRYREMLNDLDEWAPDCSNLGTDNVFELVRTFVLEHIARPALERFIDDAKSDLTPTPYSLDYRALLANGRLPEPPISISGEQVLFSYALLNDENNLADWIRAFVAWIFMRVALEEIAMSTEFHCPVHRGPYQMVLRQLPIQIHEHCHRGVVERSCGRVSRGGSLATHCDCLWKRSMVQLGVALE